MPDQDEMYNTDLVAIKDWLCKQPHLPHDVDDILLRRFLACCKHRLENTKKIIDFFFTIRSRTPDLFCNRDPWSPEIRRVLDIVDLIVLPNKTKENYRIFIYRLNNPNLDLFNFIDAVKTFFMFVDTRLTEDEDIPSGEVPIFDAANVSIKFVGKVNLSVLRKYMVYTQVRSRGIIVANIFDSCPNNEEYWEKYIAVAEAMPIRLKQVHVINAPAYIGKIYGLCKPFLKTEVSRLIKFHEPSSTTLYKDIPQELLPNDYGGSAGSVEQIKRVWVKKIEAKRDWFLKNDERWRVDEALRPYACKDERIDRERDLPGSFRSLALD